MLERLRRKLGLVVVTSILAASLAACGGDNASTTVNNAANTVVTGAGTAGAGVVAGAGTALSGANTMGATVMAGAGTAMAGGMMMPASCTTEVALNYWNPFTGPDGPAMGTMVDSFNKANGGKIKVKMTSQAEYYVQLGTAAASNTLPDVAIVHADQIATQVFNNILRPIDELNKTMSLASSDFPAEVWKAGEVAGKRYSIPLDIHPAVFFYNEDLLKGAGITTAPTNQAEFEKAAAALTKGSQKGFLITSGFFSRQIFEMILHQYGGKTFSADGATVAFNSDMGVKALQWMKDVQTKYGEPKLESDAEINGLKAGSAAMMMNGIWQTSNVTGKSVSFAGRGTAVPMFGSQMAVWAGSHQLTLPARKAPDACKDAASAMLIKYLVDNSVEWSKAGQIPANNKVRASAEFKAVQPQASIAPSVEKAFFPPAVPGITDAFAPLDKAVSDIMAGTATDIKATLDSAATQANQILTQNKSKYGTAPKS